MINIQKCLSLIVLLGILCFALDDATVPNNLEAGTKATASSVNENFDSLATAHNRTVDSLERYYVTWSKLNDSIIDSINISVIRGNPDIDSISGYPRIDSAHIGWLNPDTMAAHILTGKLTAGATEIEGSNFDINGADISSATISGGLTWGAAQNLNGVDLTNVDINSGTINNTPIAESTGAFTSITTDQIYAVDVTGLSLMGDGGNFGVFIKDGGNVGIGTNTPQAILHVLHSVVDGSSPSSGSSIILERNSTNILQLFSPNTTETRIYFGDEDFNGSGQVVYSHVDDAMFFKTNNSEKMRINSDGDVGIGTTDPDGTLHAHTASAGSVAPNVVADDFIVENNSSGGISILTPDAFQSLLVFGSPTANTGSIVSWGHSTKEMSIGTNAASGYLILNTGSSVEAVRIDSDGNVGIGTATPDGTLHAHTASAGSVTANTTANDLIVENSGNGGVSILTPDANWGILYFGSPSDNTGGFLDWKYDNLLMTLGTGSPTAELRFGVGDNVEAMRIDSDGNVGINNSSPGYDLDVTGDIRATDDLFVNDDLTVTGDVDINGGNIDGTNIGGVTPSYGRFTAVDTDSIYAVSGVGIGIMDISGNVGVFVEDGGQVGINNSSPAYDLDVTGDIRATDDIVAGDDITANGGLTVAEDAYVIGDLGFRGMLNIGVETDEVLISGDITIDNSHITVNTEGGAALDTLHTINLTGAANGDILFMHTYTTSKSVFVSSSGNILAGNGFLMNSANFYVQLMYYNSYWISNYSAGVFE